ncbi:hypothetical protein ACWDYK_08140 [Streptomyces anthocyanicus]|uniref:hypothetical protein n=2 Tax=Streptomyces anthocyanicus TaxID=68174 RepID=UPI003255D1A4
MRMRRLALMMCGILAAALMTATTSQAATRAPAAPDSPGPCLITAWGYVVPVVCRTHAYLNADWTGDGIRDEVFFISPPNNYVYRISGSSNGPVRVSNGVAWTMVGTQIRDYSGYHRVYAATAGGTVIYAQQEGSTWTPWYVYVP